MIRTTTITEDTTGISVDAQVVLFKNNGSSEAIITFTSTGDSFTVQAKTFVPFPTGSSAKITDTLDVQFAVRGANELEIIETEATGLGPLAVTAANGLRIRNPQEVVMGNDLDENTNIALQGFDWGLNTTLFAPGNTNLSHLASPTDVLGFGAGFGWKVGDLDDVNTNQVNFYVINETKQTQAGFYRISGDTFFHQMLIDQQDPLGNPNPTVLLIGDKNGAIGAYVGIQGIDVVVVTDGDDEESNFIQNATPAFQRKRNIGAASSPMAGSDHIIVATNNTTLTLPPSTEVVQGREFIVYANGNTVNIVPSAGDVVNGAALGFSISSYERAVIYVESISGSTVNYLITN